MIEFEVLGAPQSQTRLTSWSRPSSNVSTSARAVSATSVARSKRSCPTCRLSHLSWGAKSQPQVAEVARTHAAVWTVRDGKIVREAWFPTRTDALEAAGLRE